MNERNDAAIIKKLRMECRREGGQKAWAKKHNISTSYVQDILASRRGPGRKVQDALGFEVAPKPKDKPKNLAKKLPIMKFEDF